MLTGPWVSTHQYPVDTDTLWLLVAQGTWPLAGGQLNRADGTGDMAVSWGDDPEAAGENVSRWKRLEQKKNVISPGTGLRH